MEFEKGRIARTEDLPPGDAKSALGPEANAADPYAAEVPGTDIARVRMGSWTPRPRGVVQILSQDPSSDAWELGSLLLALNRYRT
jgi:hypothetical protein